ncbi:MAG TPA: phosphate acetyl/butaryl transferase [Hyphomonas sp.]|uniref:bifunctional enoyl-CoA hydratase/phosphate acetyltransferase n=1 Tax=uncultured Hyphomonas sp. TaxID=225298 RepID=UPI000C3784B2|nr:phosphate acetyl/butaryl transferase [Hyphomonas sp.]MAN91630.1 phosphate acetyl/butaryl transferase [Hyphomonadaceae bacterium]HBL93786.1 phosphate acetyl/butaryl transferase [Hyphomonas sp.]HCJ18794.1 phosphate acetyl/butaryl transferase [Hyphomonas sp.]|tara:strand:- start:46182 stop:47249 length:1068 start_codon:yes stop_codon:yes gene_type:complete
MTEFRDFSCLTDAADSGPPVKVAVVCAAQREVLLAADAAFKRGWIHPILIGDPDAIKSEADAAGLVFNPDQILPAWGEEDAALRAASLLKSGSTHIAMKGLIHTDILLKALLDTNAGLRQPGIRVSHVFLADIPAYPKLLAISDAAVNIAPDLTSKAAILQNAIDLMVSIGIDRPKAAILSAVETVNPLIGSSLDAAALSVMSQRGQVRAAIVDGPLAFDNAISLKAAEVKGIASSVAGDADILLVPDLVSGNILAKNLEYMADATLAGLVLGLSAPIVLPSRADPIDARLAGLALARLSLAARARTRKAGKDKAQVWPVHAARSSPMPDSDCCPPDQSKSNARNFLNGGTHGEA